MKFVHRFKWGLAIALVPAFLAHGFWSKSLIPQFHIHQNLTAAVLNKTYTFGTAPGGPYSFQDAAITAINKQNGAQDVEATYFVLDHFDSEYLGDSFTGLWNMRDALRKNLSAPIIDQQAAWQEMGRMLHLAQDWYSHTTWHQGNASPIVDFGKMTAPGTSSAPPPWMGVSRTVKVCKPDGFTLLSATQLSTGYYPPFDLPANKCSHGELKLNIKVTNGALCAVGSALTPDGIARDHPCSSAVAFNADYDKAVTNASEETAAFVQSIIDELKSTGNGPGFCALLGLSSTLPVCAAT